MSDLHDPDPQFIAHLEWQVASEARRRERFGAALVDPPLRRLVGLRPLAAACLLGVGLVLGTAGTVVANSLSGRQERQDLLKLIEIERELCHIELALVERERGAFEALVKEGFESTSAGAPLRDEERALRMRSVVLGLNAEEIQASGVKPNDRLSAPLVGGRDFVTERLTAEIPRLNGRVAEAQAIQERTSSLVRQGMENQAALEEAEGARVRASVDVDSVKQRLALRAEFTAERLSAKAVEIAERVQRSHMDVTLATLRIRAAESAFARYTAHYESGHVSADTATERELARAQAALSVYELERDLLLLEANDVPAKWLSDPFILDAGSGDRK